MKKIFLTSLIIFAALALSACASKTPSQPDNASSPSATAAASVSVSASYQKIAPEDVKKLMESGAEFLLADVRSAGEYNAGYIKGAVNIPVETIIGGKTPDLGGPDEKIVVYCQTGARSEAAAKELLKQGYTEVYDLGGITGWPYETVTTGQSPSPPPSDAGGVLSAFTAADIQGNFVDASVFEGHKLTMVNIWATFCGPCINEMPELGKLNVAYKDKGFQVVGIVIDAADAAGAPIKDMVDLAKEIISKTGADYEHILPSTDLNNAILGSVSAVPTTIFVDENGSQVGETVVGSQSGDDWAKRVEALLKEVE
jgi:rhodanese-related sulfurtransferase/thiol-disulfide isomerase/thioredoxin